MYPVLALKLSADGQPIHKIARPEGFIPMTNLLSTDRVPAAPKSSVGRIKVVRSTNMDLLNQFPKYDVSVALSNASCSMTFGKWLKGDAIEAKKDLSSMFHKKQPVQLAKLIWQLKQTTSSLLRYIKKPTNVPLVLHVGKSTIHRIWFC